MALNFDDMEAQAQDAARRAPSQAEVSMWGSAADMFGALSGAANHRAQYLQGDLPQSLLEIYENASETAITTHAKLADDFKPAGM